MSKRTLPGPGGDPILEVDASAAPEAVTLDRLTPGRSLLVRRVDSVSANAVTLTAPAPLTLDGAVGGSVRVAPDSQTLLRAVDGGYESFGGRGLTGTGGTALTTAAQMAGDPALTGTYAQPAAPPVLFATAPNVPVGLAVPTPDGTAQITHVGVVKSAAKWNGFRYWLVGTPYSNTNDQVENPCIYAANDPQSVGGADGWQVPAGLTNPIEPTPADGAASLSYNSDPDLEFGPDGKLYCFWRLYNVNNVGSEERIYVKSSSDGVTWSAKTLILSNAAATTRPVAPSVVYDSTTSTWRMWVVDIAPSPNVVRRYSASSATGTWTLDGTVTLTGLQSGREAWHIDANIWPFTAGQTVHMLINDVVTNTNGGGGRLYLAESTDGGMTFTVAQKPVVLSGTGRWDNALYRSSMIPIVDVGRPGYEIFYTGFNLPGGGQRLDVRFGYTTTLAESHAYATNPVHGIAAPELTNLMAARVPMAPFVIGDTFHRADGGIGTADSGQAWTSWSGTMNILSNQAKPSVDSNCKVYIDSGLADLYAEMNVTAIGGTSTQAWIIVRGVDTNNYWRIGLYNANAGTKVGIEKIQSGGSTAYQSYPLAGYWPGIRIGARCSGTTITVVVNGVDVMSVTNTFQQTATLVGFQATLAAIRVGYFYTRALVAGL